MDDVESVKLQQDDEGVLAREKDVHVGDDLEVCDDEEAEDEERRVLEGDVDGDPPDVDAAAAALRAESTRMRRLKGLDGHI